MAAGLEQLNEHQSDTLSHTGALTHRRWHIINNRLVAASLTLMLHTTYASHTRYAKRIDVIQIDH